ncbi:cardiolipin synthase [Geotalea toluenoxydans]|uniref:cardiolipin synthase n=1 Tax=Geotalea toluenoxydans TaxID=421624 RepID=UPI0006D14510|nr:cardiolipin synthase [Geotalea toluenoxydans]
MSLIRRKRKYRIFRTPRFFNMFRRNTDAAASRGNRVELFRNGEEFFSALFQAIGQAEKVICLEFYLIRDDNTGRALADAVLQAAERGVKVYLLYDYIGCFDTPGAYFRGLEKGGIVCCPFNPPTFSKGIGWFDKRDHRKIVVIDGRTAFTGGLNIGDEYAGCGEDFDRWRDVGIRLEGPAVLELNRLFRENWHRERSTIPEGCADPYLLNSAGEDEVFIVNGGPHHNRSFIRSAFRMAIAGASESIVIANPYFVPGPRVIRSLLRAVGRGVQVRLILPAKSDVPIVRLVSRSYYASLLKNGIEIYERQGTILHAKVMIIDSCWSVIGSANLDQRSFHRNYEVNVIVDSPSFGAQVSQMLMADLARSKRIVLAEHEQRGWLVRMMERVCAPVSWFL